jgi:tetratricopeptide (TPR) repeat protein
MMSGHFLGIAMMRRAWVLMDLKNYKEARQALEDDVMKACLGQFSLEELYEYFFSYGNTLGELKDIDGMNNAFSRALKIASEELKDLSRCELTWTNLMLFAERAQAWEYLESESRNAQIFAKNVVSDLLMFKAKWHHIVALKGLNRIEGARKEAEIMLKALRKIGADDAATRLQKLIDSL